MKKTMRGILNNSLKTLAGYDVNIYVHNGALIINIPFGGNKKANMLRKRLIETGDFHES